MKKYFSIDARAVLTLGRDSIKDYSTALLELVKNSYDADASLVEINISNKNNKIRVADNGDGMSEKEVDTGWLRIGYSEKRINKKTVSERRKTGEKGIGRLSADRLGSILELKSQTINNSKIGLKVNWDNFDVENKDLASIPVDFNQNPNIKIPSSNKNKLSGTELIISNLRQQWNAEDIRNLYDELSLLTPPFKGVKEDFSVKLITDIEGAEDYNGYVKSPFVGKALIEVDVKLLKTGKISYSIFEHKNNRRVKIENGTVNWEQFVTRVNLPSSKTKKPEFGTSQVILQFFPRKAETIENTEFSLRNLREFLDKNAGVKIYRDKIRVKPYGDPNSSEGDWLGLAERKTRDPSAPSRGSFRVGANQVVGAVFIGRDINKKLVDSSSREGLVQNTEYYELKSFVSGCVTLLESHYHTIFKREQAKSSTTRNVAKEVKQLSLDLKEISRGVRLLTKEAGTKASRSAEKQIDQIDEVLSKLDETAKAVEEVASRETIFRGLATLGISNAVFGHETQTAISSFITSSNSAKRFLSQKIPKINRAIQELERATNAADRIAGWGKFALLRIKRDKRSKRKVNISDLIASILDDLEPAFKASGILLTRRIAAVEGRTFAMDIESVILNLLTNAYHACQQVDKNRKISVTLKSKNQGGFIGLELVVADSGPGILNKYKDKIWEPLFTTKQDEKGKEQGTGLGLTIVKSIIDDLDGTIKYERDTSLKGAKFITWLPLR